MFALILFIRTKSKNFIEFLAENFAKSKTESNTEYFVPPKVHENSIFLYQAGGLGNSVRRLRGAEWLALFFAGAVMHTPIFVVPTSILFYYLYGNVRL